jgi:tRNA A37 threonylcarbamoyladenosine synthetase subunit TsaC/SUA5/YrdC
MPCYLKFILKILIQGNIRMVVECLLDGGIIIYPTDTVYGLGCDIFKLKAIERIAQIKGIKGRKSKFFFYLQRS